MLGNYQQMQMFSNFPIFLFPHQQQCPTNFPAAPFDFNTHELWNTSFPNSPTEANLYPTVFHSPTLPISSVGANTPGFNYLSQQFPQNAMIGQRAMLPLANQHQPSLEDLLKFMASSALSSPTPPMYSPLIPGVSPKFSSFATLPLVQESNHLKQYQASLYSVNHPLSFLSNHAPLEPSQPTSQDPKTFAPIMPSSTFEMPTFSHLFQINPEKPMDSVSSTSISVPSSPPVLTRVEDSKTIQIDDDPNPPALKPEVLMYGTDKTECDEPLNDKSVIDDESSVNFTELLDELPLLEQEDNHTLTDSSFLSNLSLVLPESTFQEPLQQDNKTFASDLSLPKVSEPRLSLEDEPLLDSLETIKKFSDELNLSEADWLEIMTESRRRKLRPSTQANTVATLTKITKDQKTVKNGRKHRSSGSAERELKSPKIARMEQQYENESENQAPSSTDLCRFPLSLDIDFYKNSVQSSIPSSSGVSSSSSFSEHSPKWKVLRRSKHGNSIWLGAQNFEEQKENLFLEQIPEEPLKNKQPKKSPKKIKQIKSNWLPVGKPIDKLVRLCNDVSPCMQQCYTSIKHRYEPDEVIKVRDCIKVRSAEGLENIGKVMNFYVGEGGYLMASVLWYYTREQIDVIKNPLLVPLDKKELLASRHIDNIVCDAIESIAFVLTFNEYCRYVTEGQIDSLPVSLRPLESQEIWSRGEENYPRRSRLPHEDSIIDVVYFSRRVYDVKMKRVYVPKLISTITIRPTLRSAMSRPIRASSH